MKIEEIRNSWRQLVAQKELKPVSYTHLDVYKRQSLTCCFAASAVSGPAQARIDGKQGNIFYTLDNAV